MKEMQEKIAELQSKLEGAGTFDASDRDEESETESESSQSDPELPPPPREAIVPLTPAQTNPTYSADAQTTDWLFSIFRDEVAPLVMLFPRDILPDRPLSFRQAAAALAGRYLGGRFQQPARDLFAVAKASIEPMLKRETPPSLEGCYTATMLAVYLCFSADLQEMAAGSDLVTTLAGFVRELGHADELLVFKTKIPQPASEFATPDLKRKIFWWVF